MYNDFVNMRMHYAANITAIKLTAQYVMKNYDMFFLFSLKTKIVGTH